MKHIYDLNDNTIIHLKAKSSNSISNDGATILDLIE